MTIEEILSNVTILKDCSTNSVYWVCAIFGGVFISLLGWWFLSRFEDSLAVEKIVEIISAFLGVIFIVFCLRRYSTLPVEIDYYISINDVAIEQIAEYFNISELSKFDDLTVCHITPKSEYYGEVLAIRNTDK